MQNDEINRDNERILSLFNLILSDTTHGNKDILNLYKLFDNLEDFVKVIKLFSGRKVKFPTEKEIDECMVLSLVYYYRYEKGVSWEEVKKMIPYDINPIGYAAKIAGFNVQLKKKIDKYLEIEYGRT